MKWPVLQGQCRRNSSSRTIAVTAPTGDHGPTPIRTHLRRQQSHHSHLQRPPSCNTTVSSSRRRPRHRCPFRQFQTRNSPPAVALQPAHLVQVPESLIKRIPRLFRLLHSELRPLLRRCTSNHWCHRDHFPQRILLT